ncbi:MAG: ABC-2 family transporter protein [Candidatus Riflebacteria bacterium]|nr:ABC-2 family transporter protein [Candidatus Riflebacteria bacterium]
MGYDGMAPADRPRRGPGLAFVVEIVRLNLMSGMAYRVSFLSQVVFMMINNAVFLAFWWIFFQRFQSVRGWGLHDVLVLFAVSAAGFGLAVVLFGNAVRLSTLIQQGEIDYYLTLPPDPLLHLLMTRMLLSGLGDLVFGVLLYALFVPSGPGSLALFLALVPVSACVFTSFCVIAHSLTFFIGSAEGISRFLSEALLTFSLYPDSLFSGTVKLLLFTLIPAGFMSYLPVQLLRSFSWSTFVGAVTAALLMAWTARTVFYAGLRRYESGNLVAPRS